MDSPDFPIKPLADMHTEEPEDIPEEPQPSPIPEIAVGSGSRVIVRTMSGIYVECCSNLESLNTCAEYASRFLNMFAEYSEAVKNRVSGVG